MSDWGARVDPYVAVNVGPLKGKTQVFKKSQDARIMETFDFPLPAGFRERSWELGLEVYDAQTNVCLGAVYLDLNEVFSEDEGVSRRAPLCLAYSSINLALDPVRFGEPVCGSITITLAVTTAFPKVPLIRERRAQLFDAQMSVEARDSLLTDKQKTYMSQLDEAVARMEAVLPQVLDSVGGSYLIQMMMGENYLSNALLLPGISATSLGGASSPNLGASSSTPKVKNFLNKLTGGGSGSGSGLFATSKTKPLPTGVEGPMKDLPPELLLRVFEHLPPWSALSVRRVNRTWESLASPALPDLWAMFHWYQKVQNASRPGSARPDDLLTLFCTKSFPFIKECAKIVQFVTSLSFLLSPIQVPAIERQKAVPLVFGPLSSVLNVVRVLSLLDLWKNAVMGAINAQRNPTIYASAINVFSLHWQQYLQQEYKDSAEASSFEDQHFWNMIIAFFKPEHSFTEAIKFHFTTEFAQNELLPYMEQLKLQLERKQTGTLPQHAALVASTYIYLLIFIKLLLGQLPKTKTKPLAVLKEYESVIPPECTRLLISQGLMKDTTYTKF